MPTQCIYNAYHMLVHCIQPAWQLKCKYNSSLCRKLQWSISWHWFIRIGIVFGFNKHLNWVGSVISFPSPFSSNVGGWCDDSGLQYALWIFSMYAACSISWSGELGGGHAHCILCLHRHFPLQEHFRLAACGARHDHRTTFFWAFQWIVCSTV